jgi:hypothetical protein
MLPGAKESSRVYGQTNLTFEPQNGLQSNHFLQRYERKYVGSMCLRIWSNSGVDPSDAKCESA